MKIVSYIKDEHEQLGILINNLIYDMEVLHPDLPNSMNMFLTYWEDTFPVAQAGELLLREGTRTTSKGFPLNDVQLIAPVPFPTSCRDGYAFRRHVEAARRNRKAEMIPEFDQFPVFYFTWDGFRYIWENVSGFKMILPILLFTMPTITAIIISFPRKTKSLTAIHYLLGWLGTILVTFSTVVVSQACWHILFEDLGKELHGSSIIGNIFITILFCFLFLLMYLPPRYGFLITEYHKLSTWIRIAIVYAPFAWQVLKGK